jgi:predicted nucleic acid-binding protein
MTPKTKPRVFLDTNVLFSGVHSESGAPKRLLDAAGLSRYQVVVSRLVLDELVRNLRSKSPSSLPKLERVFAEVRFEIVSDPPNEEIRRWRDAGLGTDAPIVAAAVLAEVDYFCTGDRRLLSKASLIERAGLRVVTPGELLEAPE